MEIASQKPLVWRRYLEQKMGQSSMVASRLRERLFGRRAHLVMPSVVLRKFTEAAPSAQNAADLFVDHWASDLSKVVPGVISGTTNLFDDPRPKSLLKNFASPTGDLSGQQILELGPLEGGHTYQLEHLGAIVTAVESNTEAFFKCLIVKELTGLQKARFLYGDCVKYLQTERMRFDIVFCCGILYHMRDPVDLIELITQRTDRIFVWTHYQDSEKPYEHAVFVEKGGETYKYYLRNNVDRGGPAFWGGNRPVSALMSRDDIMRAFSSFGFNKYEIHEDNPNQPGGPCFGMSIWRTQNRHTQGKSGP